MVDILSPEQGFVRSPEQIRELIEKLDRSGIKMSVLDSKNRTAEQEEQLLTGIQEADPSLNGRSKEVLNDIALYRQEIEAKKKWSTWEYVKSVPSRIWKTMKAHPKTTVVLTVAALGAAAYFSGVGPLVYGRLRDWAMGQFGAFGMGEAAQTVGEGIAKGTEVLKGAGEAGAGAFDAMQNIPAAPPVPGPVTPMPPANIPDLISEIGELTRDVTQ